MRVLKIVPMILVLGVVLALAVACGNDRNDVATNATPAQPAPAKAVNLTPEQLGELGAQIKQTPDRADQLLSHHGLTQESFEKAIRDVTESPDASRRYAEAYKKAGA